MLGVYRVNYTVIADDHTFSDYFFCKDKDEIKESIQALCKDYNVVDTYLGDGCISCTSNKYDLAITVESTVIFTINCSRKPTPLGVGGMLHKV